MKSSVQRTNLIKVTSGLLGQFNCGYVINFKMTKNFVGRSLLGIICGFRDNWTSMRSVYRGQFAFLHVRFLHTGGARETFITLKDNELASRYQNILGCKDFKRSLFQEIVRKENLFIA